MKIKRKAYNLSCLILAIIVAVFAVGYAFAWIFDYKGTDLIINGSSAGAYFAGGTGKEEDPYIITNSTHMYNLAWLQNTGRLIDPTDPDKNQKKYYFKLGADVEMNGVKLPPIGNDEYPFISEFDGKGYTISNLQITTDKSQLYACPVKNNPNYKFSNAVGMFGKTGNYSENDKCCIKNFILENPNVQVSAAATAPYNNGENKANNSVGLAVGYVAGTCQSIGVRALDNQKTALDVDKVGYSTFNSILGELGDGVQSSVTGGGNGSGASGNAFGATFDVDTMYDRLKKIVANKDSATPAWRLPNYGNSSKDGITLNNLEKLPFTVDASLSTYVGADAREVLANNNIGYLLGNQNKVYAKTVKFGDPIKTPTNGTYSYSDGSVPSTNKVIPRWFYKSSSTYVGSDVYNTSNMRALTEAEYNALPQGIKDLLPASNGQVEEYGSIRISQTYSNVGGQIYPGTAAGNQWSPHGQISWMGNTYGLGFTMTDYEGAAVDENGNLYTANGNLIGADGYDVDENGIYAVDPNNYPGFPYVVYSVGTAWPNQNVAFDADGNAYYRYDPGKSGLYVYGVLNNGYLRTGDNYQYYVAPVAGWDQPIALIDADGYAMYAPGVYFDVSGNIVNGAYVRDENGLYIAADVNFKMPISQIVNGYAQDADGNYYGVITINEQPVYCYLGSDGKTSGYSGWYMIDGNNFLVTAPNVDANGNIKYNDTDFYGSLNGQKGYVDANGYFYDDRHAYTVTDDNFRYLVTIVDADGYAMVDANKYYGKLKVNSTYEYAYLIKRGGKFYWYTENDSYRAADLSFNEEIKYIDADGNAMASENVYYGRYKINEWQYAYGILDVRNGKSYLNVDGNYIAEDGNSYAFIDDNGHFKYDEDSEFYRGWIDQWHSDRFKLSADGYLYDESLDANGNVKGYHIASINGCTLCDDPDDVNYGYFLDNSGNLYKTDLTPNGVRAWGYPAEEIRDLRVGNQYYSYNPAEKGNFLNAVVGGEKFTVQEGEPISVKQGEIDKAIASADINGLEGQFITPKDIEKIKVVTETVGENDKLERVLLNKASTVKFYEFKSGVALPNNGIWFKPSIAGKIRLVMYSETANDGFSLIQGHRTSATKENPFIVDYSKAGSDITVREVAKCGLPSRVLFYFEFEITQEEIDDGRYEYWILQNDSTGTGKDPGGAYFVYLDLGASAPDDVSIVVPEVDISAIDFIYDGVEIEQEDETIGIGNFIVNTSGQKALYEASKTSIYFADTQKILEVVYVRLHDRSDSKTINLANYTEATIKDSELEATYSAYVLPSGIKGGSGMVSGGGGGGGQITPTPGPNPSGETVTQTANISGAKSAGDVLFELTDSEGNTIAKVTLNVAASAKANGGTIADADGNVIEENVAHSQAGDKGCFTIELAEGYTYTVTIYAGSSGSGTRNITINGETQASGTAAVCKAVTWENLTEGTYTSSENGNIRIARIVITATPIE